MRAYFFFSSPIFTETKATANLILSLYFPKMNSFQLFSYRKAIGRITFKKG